MKTFARITSFVFVVLGLLIVIGGLIFALSGFFVETAPSAGLIDMSGILFAARVVGGGAISLQGFLIAAIGEVIWLLVDIAYSTEKTGAYFVARMQRENS